jgi:hypothetical protein
MVTPDAAMVVIGSIAAFASGWMAMRSLSEVGLAYSLVSLLLACYGFRGMDEHGYACMFALVVVGGYVGLRTRETA